MGVDRLPEDGCRIDLVSELGVLLHVGCGGAPLPDGIHVGQEVRLDSNPHCSPDILADMRELGDIGPFDGLYCNHALEHLTRADALKALREFRRVLHPGGKVIVIVPDLEDVRPTDQVLYVSPSGPITGADMYWGHQGMAAVMEAMQHRYGYVSRTLRDIVLEAGFREVEVTRQEGYNLVATGVA